MKKPAADPVLRPVDACQGDHYALGYSEREFRRLQMQSAIIGDFTADVLHHAGIRTGMRVLDLGCGVGDVSLVAGWLVGPSGCVLGVDRSTDALALAERRVAEAGQSGWVSFTAAEIDEYVPDAPFDAVVGRLVLMYLPDPATTLRRIAAYVKPGGVVAFHEMTMPPMRSHPPGALFSRCRTWIMDAIRCAGFETRMGDKLFATFLAAGLPAPRMVSANPVEGGTASPAYDYIAETLRSLLPAIERAGIATAADIDVDSLAERLRGETTANGACILLPPLVGAWTSLPP